MRGCVGCLTFEEWFRVAFACLDVWCFGVGLLSLSLFDLQVFGLAGLALFGVGYICDVVLFLSSAC